MKMVYQTCMATNSPPRSRCNYDTGPCNAMSRHSRSAHAAPRSGIVALNNYMNVTSLVGDVRFHHKGFALKGAGVHGEGRKRGVMLNFCPWCGAELVGVDGRSWHEKYLADLKGTPLSPRTLARAAAGPNPVLRAVVDISFGSRGAL